MRVCMCECVRVCACVHFYVISLNSLQETVNECPGLLKSAHTKAIILGGDFGLLALQRRHPGNESSQKGDQLSLVEGTSVCSPAAATHRLTCEAQQESVPRQARQRRGNIKHIPAVGIWASSCQAQSDRGRGDHEGRAHASAALGELAACRLGLCRLHLVFSLGASVLSQKFGKCAQGVGILSRGKCAVCSFGIRNSGEGVARWGRVLHIPRCL